MSLYPGLWKTDLHFDYSSLLMHFSKELEQNSTDVMLDNDSWQVKQVYQKNDDVKELPNCYQDILNTLGSDSVMAMAYFNLKAGGRLHNHRDMNGNLLFGVLRIHIPVKTNPKALMIVGDKDYHLPLGTAWLLDTSQIHGLINSGDDNRIHLVVDVKKTNRTQYLFPTGLPVVLHLSWFVCVLSVLILRDLIKRPKTLLDRLKSIVSNK